MLRAGTAIRRWLFALIIFTPSALGSANTGGELLFSAKYSGKHSGLKINMTKTLTQVGENQFVLSSKAKNFIGTLSEESHFLVINSKLVPISYRYFRNIFGKKSDQRIVFNWKENKAQFTRSDKPHKNKTFDIHEGVLDPSLYQIKLQQELSENKTHLAYSYAKGSGLREIEFGLRQPYQYEFSGNTVNAIKVTRTNTRKNKLSKITLIPELNYQIAEIEHIEDGKKHVVKLESYKANNALLKDFYQKISQNNDMGAKQNLAQGKRYSL